MSLPICSTVQLYIATHAREWKQPQTYIDIVTDNQKLKKVI
jgi:hypothetical protein